MMKQKYSVFFLVILLLLPQFVIAQEFGIYEVGKIIFGSEVEPEWFEPYNFLQKLFFPFVALWMVMTGIMFELRIFRTKQSINYIVAFMIAMIACPTGGLVWWVTWTSAAMGWAGWTIFVVVFIVGAYFWGRGAIFKQRGASDLYAKYRERVNNIDTEIQQLKNSEANYLNNPAQLEHIRKRIEQLLIEKENLLKAYREAY